MSDLRTMMLEAAGSPPATDARIADADLTRARLARQRLRRGRFAASSGMIAIAAVGAFAIATPGALPGTGTTPIVTAAAPATTKVEVVSTALVSYTGEQPAGYTLEKVPTGWKILSADAGTLVLAPEDYTADEPGAPGSPGAISFEGKIVVMQEGASSYPSGIRMDKVTVGGKPGVVAHMKGGGDTRTLFVKQPSGDYLAIQVWSGLGWSNDQIVEFGAGVGITEHATVGQG